VAPQERRCGEFGICRLFPAVAKGFDDSNISAVLQERIEKREEVGAGHDQRGSACREFIIRRMALSEWYAIQREGEHVGCHLSTFRCIKIGEFREGP